MKNLMFWLVAALVIFLFWSVSSRIQRDERQIRYTELLRYLEAGTILEVTVTGNDRGSEIVGTFRNGEHFRTFAPPHAYDLLDRILAAGVEVNARSESTTSWSGHLVSWTPIVIMIAFLVFFLRAGSQSKAYDAFQWRLAAKGRALERLVSSREDLPEEEILSCLLGDEKPKTRDAEAWKALYEMLAEKTIEITDQKRYRLKTAPRDAL
jgi:hypothetical protein